MWTIFQLDIIINLNLKLLIFFKFLLSISLLYCHPLYAVSQKVSVRYHNFIILYDLENEYIAKETISSLKGKVKDIESFYKQEINRSVTIVIPNSIVEFEELTGGLIPKWSNGVFVSLSFQIVIKKPEWYMQDKGIKKTLLHELSHAYFYAKFGNTSCPLWFNEGLAEYVSGEKIMIREGVQISNALFSKKLIPLKDIDSLLTFSSSQANLAYLQSLSVIHFLQDYLRTKGYGWSDFFNLVKLDGFEVALKNLTGMDQIDFEIKWYHWLKGKYRWFIFLNWENLIWVCLIIVLIGAAYAVRYRNKRLLREWEREEENVNWFESIPPYLSEPDNYPGGGN
jgi:hypothetical protein